MTYIFVLVFFVVLSQCAVPNEDWGYANVRTNAYLFWWLIGAQNTTIRDQAPLVVWLQGGPGASSTGYGNFEEIGPLDVNLKPRQYTWAQSANLLFIDSPVGTGFSYVNSPSAYCTTDDQVGVDLVELLKSFYAKNPSYQTLPLWIFCESYGGKESTSFAVALVKAMQAGTIKSNFKGVALGDSWISPIDFVLAYSEYLYETSEVDSVGRDKIADSAQNCLSLVNAGKWTDATNCWSNNQGVIEEASAGVDFYNILNRSGNDPSLKLSTGTESSLSRSLARMNAIYKADPLTDLMNGPIRQKFGIIPSNVTWGFESDAVFTMMSTAFMQPYIAQVDFLLSQGVKVNVYSGNLDLICCTTGTTNWMNKLTWPDYKNFVNAPRNPFTAQDLVVGFSKQYKNLAFWTVFAAGHMVPADQPQAGQTMLEMIITKQ
jgi:serine carboxypeptidase 1